MNACGGPRGESLGDCIPARARSTSSLGESESAFDSSFLAAYAIAHGKEEEEEGGGQAHVKPPSEIVIRCAAGNPGLIDHRQSSKIIAKERSANR